jgi:hypothetical protein
MAKVTYHIVEHDGGWAYSVDGAFSESFPSHDQALKAARAAASEQMQPGDNEIIEYEDPDGRWHVEIARGKDRPQTTVEDSP